MKEFGPRGEGRPWCPLGSANVIDLIIPHLLPHFSGSAAADDTHLASDFVLRLGPALYAFPWTILTLCLTFVLCLGPTLYAFPGTTLTLRLTLFCAWVPLCMRSPG